MADPYKRVEDWNSLVQEVNEILSNPPAGSECGSIAPIHEASPDHVWTIADVIDMRDALKATCPEITFEEPLTLWHSRLIEEIRSQATLAWCDCSFEEHLLGTFYCVTYHTEIDGGTNCVRVSHEGALDAWCASLGASNGADYNEFLTARGNASVAQYSFYLEIHLTGNPAGRRRDYLDEYVLPELQRELDTKLANQAAACEDPDCEACEIATAKVVTAQAQYDSAAQERAEKHAIYTESRARADAYLTDCENYVDECLAWWDAWVEAAQPPYVPLHRLAEQYVSPWATYYDLKNWSPDLGYMGRQGCIASQVSFCDGTLNPAEHAPCTPGFYSCAPLSGRLIGVAATPYMAVALATVTWSACTVTNPWPPYDEIEVAAAFGCYGCNNVQPPPARAEVPCEYGAPCTCSLQVAATESVTYWLSIQPDRAPAAQDNT